VPDNSEDSKALAYVKSKGLSYRENGDQIILEICPIEQCDNFHCYIAMGGNKDGLFTCHKCGSSGNLRRLQEELGDKVAGVSSFKEMAQAKEERQDRLPDYLTCHRNLLDNTEALNYLEDVRGYSLDLIKERKLGLTVAQRGIGNRIFKEKGEVPLLVIPYITEAGNLIFAKYRTLPPIEKMFDAPYGYDAPLYNEDALKPGMDDIIFVEGEGDCLSMLSNKVVGVVGVPGANSKKAAWITKLDKCAPKKIYLLYDADNVGQKAAYKMATRIGLEKVWNIVLPEFTVANADCEFCNGGGVFHLDELSTEPCKCVRPGKDVNEWFANGHTLEDLEVLKLQSVQFDVAGVTGLAAGLDQLENDIDGKGSLMAPYLTPWPSLNRKFGGAGPSDVVDLIGEEKRGKTSMALQWADFLVSEGNDTLFFCLDMPAVKLIRKWVSLVTETDDSPWQTPEEAVLRGKVMKQAIKDARMLARERTADILFASANGRDLDVMFETMKQAVRRYGVKVIVFDNLQAMCDLTLTNPSHRTIHMSQISKRFKLLATETGAFIIRIVQPTKMRDGQICTSTNADGSSQISKDCDASISIHRNRRAHMTTSTEFEKQGSFVDEDVSFEPQTIVNVDISRYAAGGKTTLWFRGEISKFEEFEVHQKQEAARMAESQLPTGGAIAVEAEI
jgi:KaiC/GvpD/RAD55 family RecA-like ATPase